LTLAWNFLQFPDIFGWSTIKTDGKTLKLSSKHVSGGERAQRAGIFLEKIKISVDSGIWSALAWNFLQFPDFFGWSTIKTNGKIQKLSSKHVSGSKRARRAGISHEKIKISADSGIRLALAWNFLQFPDFFGWPTIKTHDGLRKNTKKWR
jgi:hypothetical protein